MNPRRMTLVALLSGAALMAAEMAAGKLLFPFFGGSQRSWAMVIAAVMAGLVAGNFLGARMRSDWRNAFKWIAPLGAGLWFLLLPRITGFLLESAWSEAATAGSFHAAFTMNFIPMVMLGMLAPLWVGEAATAGAVAGRYYFFSTLGGIAATLFTGFYLLPAAGAAFVCLLAGWLCLIAAALSLPAWKWAIAPGMLAFIPFLGSSPELPPAVLYKNTSLYGELMVIDLPFPNGRPRRLLLNNRIGQSNVDPRTARSHWNYPHYLAAMAGMQTRGSRALLCGLAGGSLALEFAELGFRVDAVDIDPRTEEVARAFFALPDSVHFYCDDGRHFLATHNEKWDLIVLDLFAGESPPFHALTQEAFELVGQRLAPLGMLLINCHGFTEGEEGQGLRAVAATLQACGFTVRYALTPGEPLDRNLLFIASREQTPIAEPGRVNPCCQQFGIRGCPELHSFDADALATAPVLRDDKPLLEPLNAAAYRAWREYAVEHYLLQLKESGLGYF